MKKDLAVSDKQLLQTILSGKTKEPISRENWINFVKSSYTVENTLVYMDMTRFVELYHQTCAKIGLSSNITDEILVFSVIDGMICNDCYASKESELKVWSEDICTKLIEAYIKSGSKYEVKVTAKIRDECLRQYRKGKYHPSIFKEIYDVIGLSILETDFPKFKLNALDHKYFNN